MTEQGQVAGESADDGPAVPPDVPAHPAEPPAGTPEAGTAETEPGGARSEPSSTTTSGEPPAAVPAGASSTSSDAASTDDHPTAPSSPDERPTASSSDDTSADERPDDTSPHQDPDDTSPDRRPDDTSAADESGEQSTDHQDASPTGPVGRFFGRLDRAAGGYAVDLGLYGLSAVFALITAHTSTLLPHRAWGAIAAWAYAGAFVLAAVQFLGYRVLAREPRRAGVAYAMVGNGARAALTWTTWVAAALVPLVVEAVQRAGGRLDRAQEEVLVVERMGQRLLDDGTPYLAREAIAAIPMDERLMGYSPYQPAMALFGLPRAFAGDVWWTDARVWFAVATAAALIAAALLLRGGRPLIGHVRAVQVATVLPLCALTLATGGDDIPVLALCLLALALVATDRYGWAGAAVGLAAACKLFALPVVAVLVVLAMATGRGGRLLPGAIGLPLLVLVPPFQVDQDAFLENVIRFPLGHGLVTSPAQSPFPGYLLAQSLPDGRFVAVGLLVAVALAITVRMLLRPPRTAATAALICGWGLLAAILLMPTTRFGYLLYPAAFLVWAGALTRSPVRDSGTTQLQVAHRDDTALYRL